MSLAAREARFRELASRFAGRFVPLLGDTARNRVRFFAPPQAFREPWLRPLPSYDDGAPYAEQYEEVDLGYDIGSLYLADAATMHQSARCPGAGARASIDVNFLLRPRAGSPAGAEVLSQEDLRNTGRTRLFLFTDSMAEQVDTQGGRRHPTERRRIVDIGAEPRPPASRVRGLRVRSGSRIPGVPPRLSGTSSPPARLRAIGRQSLSRTEFKR